MDVRKIWRRAVPLAALAVLGAGVGAVPARAAFGEVGRLGGPGTGAGLFATTPYVLRVDGANGDVYAGEYTDFTDGVFTLTRFPASGAPQRTDVQYDAAGGSRYPIDVAIDGFRHQLYMLMASDSGATEVLQYDTTNLSASPTTFLSESDLASDPPAVAIAVDPTNDATFGGRVYVAFTSFGSSFPTLAAYVEGFSPSDHARLMRIGDPDRPGTTGNFDAGSLFAIGVAADHKVFATTTNRVNGLDNSAVALFDPSAGPFADAGDIHPGELRASSTVLGGPAVPTSDRFGVTSPSDFAVAPNGHWVAWTGMGPTGANPHPLWYSEFDESGQRVRSFGTTGTGACLFVPASGSSLPSVLVRMGADDEPIVLDMTTSQIIRFGRGKDATGCGFEPTVDGSADTLTPTAGQPVTFTASGDSPEGEALTYDWDLDGDTANGPGGDGFEVTGAEAARQVTFAHPGSVDVRVRAVDADGSLSAPKIITVTVKSAPPAAKLSVPATAVTGQPVTLDASTSTTGSSPIAKYEFDTGSGTFDTNNGTGAKLTKVYATAGTYKVRVRVTDSATPSQSSTSATQQIVVKDPDPDTHTTIDKSPPPTTNPVTTPTTGKTPPPPPPTLKLTLPRGTLTAASANVVKLKLGCPSRAGACTGTVKLATATAVAASAKKGAKKPVKRVVVLGTASLRVAGGKQAVVTVRLSRAGAAVLKKLRKVRVSLTVTAKGRDGSTGSQKATLTLRAAPAKKPASAKKKR